MGRVDFVDLPELCISAILSLTSPKDVCRSAATAFIFRSAAESDSVWEKFLPAEYREILMRAVSAVQFSSNKELYFRLCDSILIDGGTKSVFLDKPSGKKGYMLGARQLSIAWGDTNSYWKWVPLPESRFKEVAELRMVWWLDINGRFDTSVLSPNTTYAAYLIVKFKENWEGLGYGPTAVSVELGHHESRSTALLCPDNTMTESWSAQSAEVRVPRDRTDGWMENELGNFYNDDGHDGEVMMKAYNHDCSYWKRGLIIEGIEVRPKE